jgi:hypothetical protein
VFPVREGVPERIKRRVATPDPFQQIGLVPYVQTVHDRMTVEIRRGCTRGCRFCQPGMLTRPARDVEPAKVRGGGGLWGRGGRAGLMGGAGGAEGAAWAGTGGRKGGGGTWGWGVWPGARCCRWVSSWPGLAGVQGRAREPSSSGSSLP